MYECRKLILVIYFYGIIFLTNSLAGMEDSLKELIIVHNNLYFSHDTVCSLALVDKFFNNMIQKTALLRKNYLENYVKGSNIKIVDYSHKGTMSDVMEDRTYIKDYISTIDVSVLNDIYIKWHKNGSACSFIERSKINFIDSWYFKLFYFSDEGFIKERCYHDYDNLYQWPNNKSFPFFNNKGDACFYRVTEGNFYEYSIGREGAINEVSCFIELHEEPWSIVLLVELLYFIKFPTLLNAILSSGKDREKALHRYYQFRCYDKNWIGKVYRLNDIIIPDNYDSYVQFNEYIDFFNKSIKSINRFYDLGFSMKEAILKKYNSQKCSSVLECLPKIVIEKIGSMIKRVGRDAFRCVSKPCNKIMWSQDELNHKLILAYCDEDKPFYKQSGAWKHPFLELQDLLRSSNVTLALVKWLIYKWSLNDLQYDYLFFCAKNNKHYEIAQWLDDYRKRMTKT